MTADRSPESLWKKIEPDDRKSALIAFWRGRRGGADVAHAWLGKARNSRPQAIASRPPEWRAAQTAGLKAPDWLVSEWLVAHHVSGRRPLLARFLDMVGVAHEDGLVAGDWPDTEALRPKLAEAVAALRAEFSATDVEVYFATLCMQGVEAGCAALELLDGDAPAGS